MKPFNFSFLRLQFWKNLFFQIRRSLTFHLNPKDLKKKFFQLYLKLGHWLNEFHFIHAFQWLTKNLRTQKIILISKSVAVLFTTYLLSELIALGLGTFFPQPSSFGFQNFQIPMRSFHFPPSFKHDYLPILEKNIFRSQIQKQEEIQSLNSYSTAKSVLSSLPLTLVAVMIPEDSSQIPATAIIRNKKTSRSYAVKEGEKIPEYPRTQVIQIQSRIEDSTKYYRLTFLNHQRLEFIEMTEEAGHFANTLSSSSSSEKKSPAQQLTIPRSEINQALANFESLGKQADAEEISEGFRFTRIDSGSIYETLLQLREGDILMSLNGIHIKDGPRLLELISKLPFLNQLVLQFKRDEKVMIHNYQIINS